MHEYVLTVAQTLELALALHLEAPRAMERGLAADPPVLQTTLQGERRRRRRRDQEMRALHVCRKESYSYEAKVKEGMRKKEL